MTGLGARIGLVGGILLAGVAGVTVVNAQPQARAPVVQRLTDCRKLADDAARLKCYDAAAAEFATAEAKGDIVVVDREQARAVRRQAFGFRLPSISIFARGEGEKELDEVTATIAKINRTGDGKLLITLPDGAVWVQVDTKEPHRTPKVGMKVEIKQATLGSFLMSIDDMGSIRVRRTE